MEWACPRQYLLAKGAIVIAAVRRPESMKGHQVAYKLLVVEVVHNNTGYSVLVRWSLCPCWMGRLIQGSSIYDLVVSCSP